MTLDEKISSAEKLVARVLRDYRAPCFMCSFGKDSMVLLWLLRAMKVALPVVFYRDPWWPRKYQFAERIIRECGLVAYDYPPIAVSLWEGKSIMAFTNHYQVGPLPNGLLHLPKNIAPPVKGKRYLCALKDVLSRPTGGFNYPWDVALIGHKSSDEDQIAGKVPLHVDIKLNHRAGPDLAFPLRHWTDQDIWDYSDKFRVPQQEDRYDVANRTELPDKFANSDYSHVCIACCDRRNKAPSVTCPKTGLQVSNVSDLVPYHKPQFTYYGDAQGGAA